MNIPRKLIKPLVLVCCALSLAACGGDGGGSAPAQPTGISAAYYPVTTGSRWSYDVTSSDTPATYVNDVEVTGTQLVSGVNASVFRESNPDGSGKPVTSYYLKDARAFVYVGDNAPANWLSAAIGRFDLMRFDGTFSASPLLVISNVLTSEDLDGDGLPERLDGRITGVVEGDETQVTPAGSFANTARLRYDIAGTVTLSRGGTVPVAVLVREWRAPGVGMVRATIGTTVAGTSLLDTVVLRGFWVDAAAGGTLLPRPLLPNLAPADSDTTRPGRPAAASDGTRFLLVSNRTVTGGRQWVGQFVGADGRPQTGFDLSPPQTSLSPMSAASWDGSNYLVITGDASGLRAQRVSAAGAVLDAYPGVFLGADAFNPAVAFGGGTYLVVYRRSSAPGAILARRLSPSGVLGAEIVVAVGGAADAAYPSVAFQGSHFLTAWETNPGSLDPASTDVVAARVSSAGVVQDAPPIAVSTAPEAQTAPQVACDGTNCLVSWMDRRSYPGVSYSFSPGPGDMYGALVSQAGIVLNGPPATGGLPLATGISANAGYPGLVFTGGDYLLAWSRGAFVNNPGGPTGMFATRVSLGGVPGVVVDVSSLPPAATTLRYVTMAAAPSGTLVAWLDNVELIGAFKSISGTVVHPPAAR